MQAPDPLQACEIEVYVAPLQARQLRATQAGVDGEHDQAPLSVSTAADSSRLTSSASSARISLRATFGARTA